MLGACASRVCVSREREFFIDNLLVRLHFIAEMIQRTGLAPWVSELPLWLPATPEGSSHPLLTWFKANPLVTRFKVNFLNPAVTCARSGADKLSVTGVPRS